VNPCRRGGRDGGSAAVSERDHLRRRCGQGKGRRWRRVMERILRFGSQKRIVERRGGRIQPLRPVGCKRENRTVTIELKGWAPKRDPTT